MTLEDSEGLKGYGEGTPRSFVTGESISECIEAAAALGRECLKMDLQDMSGSISFLQKLGSSLLALENPSAWCAVELACLDLLAKQKEIPLWNLFVDKSLETSFTYSAVIPILGEKLLTEVLNLYKNMNMQFFKIKVREVNEGIALLKRLRDVCGEEVGIRVDANGAFTTNEALNFLKAAKAYSISSIEQPVAKDNLTGLREITNSGLAAVIVDESLCSKDDAEYLVQNQACNGFNVRLSKCGGFQNSLSLWGLAYNNQLFCQIGCHVGESGILSAAGRHLAALCPNRAFLEGSFAKILLQKDIVKKDISFGQMGKAPLLTESGLGVEVDDSLLAGWGEQVSLWVDQD